MQPSTQAAWNKWPKPSAEVLDSHPEGSAPNEAEGCGDAAAIVGSNHIVRRLTEGTWWTIIDVWVSQELIAND